MLLTYSTFVMHGNIIIYVTIHKINNEIQLAVDHVDFLTYQVGEVTEEAHRLLFWLRVILSVVITVKITGYRDSTLLNLISD